MGVYIAIRNPSILHCHPCPLNQTDSDTISPDVSPRPHGDEMGVGLEKREGDTEVADAAQEESDGSPFSSSDDGPFAKSSMYVYTSRVRT